MTRKLSDHNIYLHRRYSGFLHILHQLLCVVSWKSHTRKAVSPLRRSENCISLFPDKEITNKTCLFCCSVAWSSFVGEEDSSLSILRFRHFIALWLKHCNETIEYVWLNWLRQKLGWTRSSSTLVELVTDLLIYFFFWHISTVITISSFLKENKSSCCCIVCLSKASWCTLEKPSGPSPSKAGLGCGSCKGFDVRHMLSCSALLRLRCIWPFPEALSVSIPHGNVRF